MAQRLFTGHMGPTFPPRMGSTYPIQATQHSNLLLLLRKLGLKSYYNTDHL